MEVNIVGVRHRSEKLRCPGAAVAAIEREALVDFKLGAGREGDQLFRGAKAFKVGVVLHTDKAVFVGHLVLVQEDLRASLSSQGGQ